PKISLNLPLHEIVVGMPKLSKVIYIGCAAGDEANGYLTTRNPWEDLNCIYLGCPFCVPQIDVQHPIRRGRDIAENLLIRDISSEGVGIDVQSAQECLAIDADIERAHCIWRVRCHKIQMQFIRARIEWNVV